MKSVQIPDLCVEKYRRYEEDFIIENLKKKIKVAILDFT